MRRWLLPALFLLPILFFGLFYFYPLLAILRLSFFPEEGGTLQALSQLFATSYYLETLWFTTWQALLSTALTVLLALPGAYVFARYDFRGKESLRAIITLPFVLPTIVVANAFAALLGPRGLLNAGLMAIFPFESPPIQLEFTIWMILLAHIFYNYSVALRIISSYWQNLDPQLVAAARALGLNGRQAFWQVTFPILRPAIWSAAVLIFIFTFTSFGVILILGGPRYATLEVEIYRQAVNLFDLPVAATLSLLQIGITFVLMWFYTHTQSRVIHPLNLRASRGTLKKIQTTWERLLVGGNLLLMLLLLGTPLLALLLRSVQGEAGLTLRYYQELSVNRSGSIFFVPPIEAVRNSTGFALATMLLAVVLGLLGALAIVRLDKRNGKNGEASAALPLLTRLKGLLDPLLMLPLATSAVTLGFGFILALNRPPFELRRSLIIIPIAHTLVAMPFVIRTILPALRRINPRLHEAARILGLSAGEIWWRVDWALIQKPLLVGAVFAFTISMGEFGATLFVSRPDLPTLPVAIFRFLGQPGAVNYGQALAMSSLLMGVCALGFVLIERLQLGDEGEF